jgi:drug/metabolite transporter (DMT)-like permease
VLTWACFLTVVLAWGASYLAIAVALRSFAPMGLVAARCVLAALVCLVIGRWRREAWPHAAHLPRLALLGALLIAGSNGLTTLAQKQVPSGLAGLMHALTSVWLVLFSWRREQPGPWAAAGAVAGVLGVGVLLLPTANGPVHAAGLGLLLLGTLTFSSGTMFQRHFGPLAGRFTQLGLQMCAAAAITGGLALGQGGLLAAPLAADSLSAYVFLAVVCSVLAFVCYGRVVEDWPAARVGSWSVLTPLVAVALGAALLREPLSARLLTGGTLILGGVALVQFKSRHPPVAAPGEDADHG